MSYILDALRKAERERNLGQPPSAADLSTVAAPAGAGGGVGRRWIWALAALALGILVLTLVLVLRPQAQVPMIVAAPPKPIPAAPPASSPSPAAPAAAIDATENLATLDDLADAAATFEEPLAQTESEPTLAAGPPAEPIRESEPIAETDGPPDAMPEETASTSKATLLRDMPEDFRYSFPAIAIQVHVYDELPEKRWLLIANRRYAEGTALTEGPRVAEILPEGVVFEHRGQEVLYPLN